MSKITAKKVNSIFLKCLFKEEEETANQIQAQGIVTNVGFHPERLRSHKEEIAVLLNELPENFRQSGGGGWSFLQACDDKHGNQWTGLHRDMEQLFLMGLATSQVVCLMPKDMWEALPGGMPYYMITSELVESTP